MIMGRSGKSIKRVGRLSREKAKSRDTDDFHPVTEAFNSFSCQNDNFFSFAAFFIFSFSFAVGGGGERKCGWHAKGSIGDGRSPFPISNQYPSKTIGRVFLSGQAVCVCDLNTLSLWLTSIHQTHPPFQRVPMGPSVVGIKSGQGIVEQARVVGTN